MVTLRISYMSTTLWALPAEQVLETFFCKGPDSKNLILCVLHVVSVTTTQFCHVA